MSIIVAVYVFFLQSIVAPVFADVENYAETPLLWYVIGVCTIGLLAAFSAMVLLIRCLEVTANQKFPDFPEAVKAFESQFGELGEINLEPVIDRTIELYTNWAFSSAARDPSKNDQIKALEILLNHLAEVFDIASDVPRPTLSDIKKRTVSGKKYADFFNLAQRLFLFARYSAEHEVERRRKCYRYARRMIVLALLFLIGGIGLYIFVPVFERFSTLP